MASVRKLKLYVETSVWSFLEAEDVPFERSITQDFFKAMKAKRYDIFISEVVMQEIDRAETRLGEALKKLIGQVQPTMLSFDESAQELTQVYLSEGIIPVQKRDDARHVAIATANELDALVTWNFRHLANLRKKELFNSVNRRCGYFKELLILPPMEVAYEE